VERDRRAKLEGEVRGMETFGAKAAAHKDTDVVMVENPLMVHLREIQQRYDAQDLKLRQAEAEERMQRGGQRQDQISKMTSDRDNLKLALDKLKAQLQEQEKINEQKAMEAIQASTAQNPHTSAAVAAPVRTNFEPARPKAKLRESQ